MSRSGIPVIICEHRIDLELLPDIEWRSLPDGKKVEFECVVEEVNENYSLLCAPFQTCGIIGGFAIDGGFIDGYISSNAIISLEFSNRKDFFARMFLFLK